MIDSSKILLEKYQIRKTKKQKQEFTIWLKQHLNNYGYHLQEDNYSKSGTNLIVGDIKSSKVILTAHYDTQPNAIFPVFMGFSNWIVFFLSQILSLLPIILIFIAYLFINGEFGQDSLTITFRDINIINIFLLAYFFQLIFGFANKHTANDNTSGVATLISILESLPQKDRDKVCVVFFDQEELGLVGSSNFSKKYASFVQNKPLINFDCVSDGDTLTFISKKSFRKSEYIGLLQSSAKNIIYPSNKKYRFGNAIWNIYMSDQLYFNQGVGVVAAKKIPVLGYYIDRIHSLFDTKFDSSNIQLLTNTILDFTEKI